MDLALCVVVAACWGATNPLLEKGARDEGEGRKEDFAAAAFVGWLARWRFVAPFLLNQAGSVLNVYLVSRANLLVSVPVTNGLSIVFNALSSSAMGERVLTARTVGGATLVVAGASLCSLSST